MLRNRAESCWKKVFQPCLSNKLSRSSCLFEYKVFSPIPLLLMTVIYL